MVNMVNTAVNNNIYAGRKSGSKYNQSKAFQQKEVLETPDVAAVNKYANVQEIYAPHRDKSLMALSSLFYYLNGSTQKFHL